jgi:hypothetical protein
MAFRRRSSYAAYSLKTDSGQAKTRIQSRPDGAKENSDPAARPDGPRSGALASYLAVDEVTEAGLLQ